MKFLLTTTESYRIDTEKEVETAIQEAKEDPSFILKKYDRTFKEKTKGGEIVDSYFILKLTKQFNMEKEPVSEVSISYGE